MNEARLLRLAELLETVPEEKFDLGSWRDCKIEKRPEVFALGLGELKVTITVTDDKLRNECGYTGCAIGWATAAPEFQEEGLRWDAENIRVVFNDQEWGKTRTGWAAIGYFFGVSQTLCFTLFSEDRYDGCRVVFDSADSPLPTPAGVAKRIRDYVVWAKTPQGLAEAWHRSWDA